MPNRTTAKHELTEDQLRNLTGLLNMIIPPDPNKGMPGAGELDFIAYLSEFAANQIDAICLELDELNQAAKRHYQCTFADLHESDREGLIDRLRTENPLFAQRIAVQTMACYYQADPVVVALGMEARPPFPKGNEVVAGDLSLLDPVRRRKKIYREI